MNPPDHHSVQGPFHPGLLHQDDAELQRELDAAMSDVNPAELTSTAEAAPPEPQSAEPGALVRGRVANVASRDVLVDLGGKMLGVIPRGEFATAPALGDEVEALVEGADARGGLLNLSRKKAAAAALWRDVAVGRVYEGPVTGMNKGGLEVDLGGVRAFIPSSQVDTHFMRDISELIGRPVRVEVTKVDRAQQNLVVSRRIVLEREAKEQREKILGEMKVGDVLRGRVRNLAEYGAFVELTPGVDGLLHVSDMSWGRIDKPESVVSIGQEIDVQVLKVNRETGKVSLGLKQVLGDPWEKVAERYPPQMRLNARVARLANFGAFVSLEEGVDGLIPLSEMSWAKRLRHPKEMLNEGDVVEVVVLSVETERKRITLGLKQLAANPWENVRERYPSEQFFPARVLRLAEFGAFVELESGLEGLLHISEISEERIRTVADKLAPEQEIQVRVLKIEPEQQRISLSMRPPPAPKAAPSEMPRPAAPRKRPAPKRGGLDMDWQGQGLGSLDPRKYAR